MAVKTQITVEEYLQTSFEVDCEYLDGEVVERNVGEYAHSKAQRRLVFSFGLLSQRLPFYACPEIRVQVAPRRYRVVDLAVFAGDEPAERVPSQPPLVAIEIVSRKDVYRDIIDKLEDYRKWGVSRVWLVDPWIGKLYTYSAAGLTDVASLQIPEYGVEIPAAEVLG